MTVSVLESYPCPDSGSNPSLPRQYSGPHDGLRDVRFNGSPENRISAGRINQAIDVGPRIAGINVFKGLLSILA